MKLAIVSDCHAFTPVKDGPKPSWLNLAEDQSNPRSNPFAGLEKLIQDENLTADVVLCCGDLGDRAEPSAQQYVWDQIQKTKDCIQAKMVIGTSGNHDVDSRFQHTKYDAKGNLQSLRPMFPIGIYQNWLEYWAKNYTIFEQDSIRFLVINSAAYHGYDPDPEKPEFYHGRISDGTIDNIVQDISNEGPYSVNIAFCHHHPFKNDQIKIDDYSEMQNGDRLINELTAIGAGPWLVIHGHKHMPRISYAQGGNLTPVIFGTASFAAKPYPEYQEKGKNEFYLLELDVPDEPGKTSTVKGTAKSWQWSYGNGWVRPKVGSGLGPSAAFGSRVDVAELASELVDHLKNSNSSEAVPWNDILELKPKIKFLIPEDLDHLIQCLEERAVKPLLNQIDGTIAEIQVPPNE